MKTFHTLLGEKQKIDVCGIKCKSNIYRKAQKTAKLRRQNLIKSLHSPNRRHGKDEYLSKYLLLIHALLFFFYLQIMIFDLNELT